ncbi:MAG: PKD domain-containing protein [Armatimonadetes bacterium]|nr:PKD domain-containing protein [Armatimonadota bacterium]
MEVRSSIRYRGLPAFIKIAGLCAFAVMVMTVGAANAQLASIYSGSGRNGGVEVASWGSGEVAFDQNNVYTGVRSIKVTTQGMFQGARIELAEPIDLSPYIGSTSDYLDFVFRIARQNRNNRGYGFGPGGFMGGPPNTMTGPPNFGGYNQNNQNQYQQNVEIKDLRYVLVTTDGKRVEGEIPIKSQRQDDQGWYNLGVPFAVMKTLASGDKLKEVQVFADAPGSFYLGEIHIINDTTPIHANSLDDQTEPKDSELTFRGSADDGVTPLVYSWNFGEIKGDKGVDAVGRRVTHIFRKSGDYTVTLTVSDLYGFKKPSVTTCRVRITL